MKNRILYLIMPIMASSQVTISAEKNQAQIHVCCDIRHTGQGDPQEVEKLVQHYVIIKLQLFT